VVLPTPKVPFGQVITLARVLIWCRGRPDVGTSE
jgi:hypothetical protein